MNKRYCYYCMNEVASEAAICPYCRREQPYVSRDGNDLPAGTILKKRYIIGRLLGRGGFGATYLTLDRKTGSKVAVKEFFPLLACSRQPDTLKVEARSGQEEHFQSSMESFRQEIRNLGKLRKASGVVHCQDSFSEYGTLYMVMDYLEGCTLKELLEARRAPFSMLETVDFMLDSLRALQGVHKAGLLHRDISPDNIFLQTNGSICLIDFGSSRRDAQASMTSFSKGVYTPPEQKMEDVQGPYTDLYALGVTMFVCLVGRSPQEEQGALLEPLPPIFPEALRAIYQKATAAETSQRYQTADEMITELEASIADDADDEEAPKIRSKSGQTRVLLSLLLALVVLLTAITALLVSGSKNSGDALLETGNAQETYIAVPSQKNTWEATPALTAAPAAPAATVAAPTSSEAATATPAAPEENILVKVLMYYSRNGVFYQVTENGINAAPEGFQAPAETYVKIAPAIKNLIAQYILKNVEEGASLYIVREEEHAEIELTSHLLKDSELYLEAKARYYFALKVSDNSEMIRVSEGLEFIQQKNKNREEYSLNADLSKSAPYLEIGTRIQEAGKLGRLLHATLLRSGSEYYRVNSKGNAWEKLELTKEEETALKSGESFWKQTNQLNAPDKSIRIIESYPDGTAKAMLSIKTGGEETPKLAFDADNAPTDIYLPENWTACEVSLVNESGAAMVTNRVASASFGETDRMFNTVSLIKGAYPYWIEGVRIVNEADETTLEAGRGAVSAAIPSGWSEYRVELCDAEGEVLASAEGKASAEYVFDADKLCGEVIDQLGIWYYRIDDNVRVYKNENTLLKDREEIAAVLSALQETRLELPKIKEWVLPYEFYIDSAAGALCVSADQSFSLSDNRKLVSAGERLKVEARAVGDALVPETNSNALPVEFAYDRIHEQLRNDVVLKAYFYGSRNNSDRNGIVVYENGLHELSYLNYEKAKQICGDDITEVVLDKLESKMVALDFSESREAKHSLRMLIIVPVDSAGQTGGRGTYLLSQAEPEELAGLTHALEAQTWRVVNDSTNARGYLVTELGRNDQYLGKTNVTLSYGTYIAAYADEKDENVFYRSEAFTVNERTPDALAFVLSRAQQEPTLEGWKEAAEELITDAATPSPVPAEAAPSKGQDSSDEAYGCAHSSWFWASNGNGTHVKKCKSCQTCFGDAENCRYGYEAADNVRHKKICMVCAEAFNEYHSFVNGYCSKCGKPEDKSAPTPTPTPTPTPIPMPTTPMLIEPYESRCEHDVIYCIGAGNRRHNCYCYICDEYLYSENCIYGTAYRYTNYDHWQECLLCANYSPYEDHVFDDGRCVICNYTCRHSVCTLFDCYDYYHFYSCEYCGEYIISPHEFDNGRCVICNYTCRHSDCTLVGYSERNHLYYCHYCGEYIGSPHEIVNGKCKGCPYTKNYAAGDAETAPHETETAPNDAETTHTTTYNSDVTDFEITLDP